MISPFIWVLSSALVSTFVGSALPSQGVAAERALYVRYPGVRIARDTKSGLVAVYGRPMTEGATPGAAIDDWLTVHADLLGASPLDLRERRARQIGFGPLEVHSFRQYLDGLPVENGFARFVVRTGEPDVVVFVGAKLAQAPEGGFARTEVDSGEAMRRAAARLGSEQLNRWWEPELVVLFDGPDGLLPCSLRAWKVRATGSRVDLPRAFTIFVEAEAGSVVLVRNEIVEGSASGRVKGRVTGYATPGTLPDVPANPPVERGMADVRVRAGGGETVQSSPTGSYRLDFEPNELSMIEADLVGAGVTTVNRTGATLHLEAFLSEDVSVVSFAFNETPSEPATAQVNAFIHASEARVFYRSRQPGFVELDESIACKVNLGSGHDCSAGFDPVDVSLIFTRSTDVCPNAAYSTVVTHEYGHYIVHHLELPLPQGAFGEGFSDALSLLIHEDPVIGRGFMGPGTLVRDIVAANAQYPCGKGDHACGQVLAGVWWDMKNRMKESIGPGAGLAQTQQLFTNWSRITVGGSGSDSAHPITAIEVLTVDDDDGDFTNLTPRFREICDGFEAHRLACPISDCNENGFDDGYDLSYGVSNDCSGNGIPDECEPDCNLNGEADSCDIFVGEADEDGNGVPDACQQVLSVPSVAYPTIQEGLDGAEPGDTVLVAAGSYRGPNNRDLDFGGKVLQLRCEDTGSCVIDCERSGRGFHFQSGEPSTSVVDGFTVINGSPQDQDRQGAAVRCFGSSPTFRRCTFTDNATTGSGGAFWSHVSDLSLEDCVIVNNRGRAAGGLALGSGTVRIRRCTISRNSAQLGNAINVIFDGQVDVRDSIIWDNGRGSGSGILSPPESIAIAYSLVAGGWAGVGNIGADPLFANASAGDFGISIHSVCVNRGDPAVSLSGATDAAGHPRQSGCRVDMGALETTAAQEPADFDHDGRWSLPDIAALQICYGPSAGTPSWSQTCHCVFETGAANGIGPEDFAAIRQVLTGP